MEAVQAGAQDYLVKGQVDGHLLHAPSSMREREAGAERAPRTLSREQAAQAHAAQAERRLHDIVQGFMRRREADAQTWQFTFVSQRGRRYSWVPYRALVDAAGLLGKPHPSGGSPAEHCLLCRMHGKAWISVEYRLWLPTGGRPGCRYRARGTRCEGPVAAAGVL